MDAIYITTQINAEAECTRTKVHASRDKAEEYLLKEGYTQLNPHLSYWFKAQWNENGIGFTSKITAYCQKLDTLELITACADKRLTDSINEGDE